MSDFAHAITSQLLFHVYKSDALRLPFCDKTVACTAAVMQTEPEQSGASDKSSWTPTFRDYTPSDLQENDQEPQEEGEEDDEDDTSPWQQYIHPTSPLPCLYCTSVA